MKSIKTAVIHILLFVVTLITTTLAGAEYIHANSFFFSKEPLGLTEFWSGLQYSLPFLAILSFHEFGHYFTALYYNLKVTLPYYLPFWIPGMPQFGTFGAVIRIKSPIRSRKVYFDVGVAGPLAGFIIALLVLCYGFTHLPPPEYIFSIHPEWAKYGLDYPKHVYKDMEMQISMNTNLLFEILKATLVDDTSKIPPVQEMMHYPFLLAGYFACFFTALNLIPIGQLDGGHILYGLIGKKGHEVVSPLLFCGLLFWGGLGMLSLYDTTESLLWNIPMYVFFLYYLLERAIPSKVWALIIALSIFLLQFVIKSYWPEVDGFRGWLFFGFLLGRVLGVHHPPVEDDKPLSMGRKLIGWLSLIVFILCFSPVPFIVE